MSWGGWTRGLGLLGLAVGLVVGACGPASAFSCEDDGQCGAGTCESGFCAFPDEACESGRRFGEHAGNGLAGGCVPVDAGEATGGTGSGTSNTSSTGVDTLTTSSVTSSTSGDDSTTMMVDETTSGPVSDSASDSTKGLTTDPGSTSSTGTPLARIDEGLIAYYRPDDLDSGDTVPDISGVDPALDMTLQGGGFTWGNDGLITDGTGIVVAQISASKIRTACQASEALTVEAWITPALADQVGPARIVTYSPDALERNFMLGQGEVDVPGQWAARIRTTTTTTNGQPSVLLAHPTAAVLTHLVFTQSSDGSAEVYVDGAFLGAELRDGDLSGWDASSTYQFAWGNEPTLNRPWLGTFHLVAIYDRALDADEIAQNYDVGLE